MFVDYLTLQLVTAAAGLFMVAVYLIWGLEDVDQRRWAPGFFMIGLVLLVTGFDTILNWPLPSSYNIAFGEMATFLGAILFTAGLACAFNVSQLGATLFSLPVGVAVIIVGVRLINRGMTQSPLIAGAGYILAGVGAILALPVVLWFRRSMAIRVIGALVVLGAAGVLGVTGYIAYWDHLEAFSHWVPILQQIQQQLQAAP